MSIVHTINAFICGHRNVYVASSVYSNLNLKANFFCRPHNSKIRIKINRTKKELNDLHYNCISNACILHTRCRVHIYGEMINGVGILVMCVKIKHLYNITF